MSGRQFTGQFSPSKNVERARVLLFPPFDITQLRDSISQTVAFSIVCYRNHYFSWGNLFRFLRSHPKSSNRRRYFPSSSYRLTGPKWNFPSPPSCTNIHQPNPFVKSQRINKKTSGGKKSQTIYPTSINFSKWAAPTFSSPTRIIVDVIIKYHTALSLSHHTHKNWSSKSLGGGRIIMEPLLPFRPPNTKKWGKKFIS